ncbi:uncharacterized protein ACIBXB_007849 [Morphnus guianensis]
MRPERLIDHKEREKGKERRPHGHGSWDSDGHEHPSPPGGGRQVRGLCVRARGQRLREVLQRPEHQQSRPAAEALRRTRGRLSGRCLWVWISQIAEQVPRATRLQTTIPLRSTRLGEGHSRLNSTALPAFECRQPPPVAGLCPPHRQPLALGEAKNAPGPMPRTGVRGRGMPLKLDTPSRLHSACQPPGTAAILFPLCGIQLRAREKPTRCRHLHPYNAADLSTEPSCNQASRGRPDTTGRPRMAHAGRNRTRHCGLSPVRSPGPRGLGEAAARTRPPSRLHRAAGHQDRLPLALCPIRAWAPA